MPHKQEKVKKISLEGWRLLLYLKNPHGGLTQNIRFFYNCFRNRCRALPKQTVFRIRVQLEVCGFGSRKAKGTHIKRKVKNRLLAFWSGVHFQFWVIIARSGFIEYGTAALKISHARK
jgi:hypothetical protein